jgi:hypothetical protein
MAVQFRPASSDFQMPLSVDPGSTRGSLHFLRVRCHVAA